MEQEPVVYRMDNGKTPWDMPYEIFWDIRPLASVRRALWAVQNAPEVDIEEVTRVLALSRGSESGGVPEVELLEAALGYASFTNITRALFEKLFPDLE